MEMNVFTGRINNWIQWSPGPGFWSPVNYKNVWNRGLELDADYHKSFGKLGFLFRVNYSLTFSTVEDTEDSLLSGKQLKYTPTNILSSSLSINYQSFYSDLAFRSVGSRYTTEDNNPVYALNSYYSMDFIFGYKMLRLLPGSYIQVKVKNITNEKYQVIRSYPMPGRAWYLGIIIKFNKKSKL
jgi:outer membrane cobalamin receptor